MREDSEGFRYPHIDLSVCIRCDLCEKVCPVIHPNPDSSDPRICLAAKSRNGLVREESTSGGVFTLLAADTIAKGGVVFGARFDDGFNVVHDYATTLDGVASFRSSKYVQSYIGDSFLRVRQFLKEGRPVLFSGTPCQVAGLRRFLRKPYSGLTTVDFICHGVPSPQIWRLYRDSVARKLGAPLTAVSFRQKNPGWRDYSVRFAAGDVVSLVSHREDPYMRGFLNHLYLRPSCADCPAKGFTSGSDVKIADYWGISRVAPDFDDDRGVSLVFIKDAASPALGLIRAGADTLDTPLEPIRRLNPSLYVSSAPAPRRDLFFKSVGRDSDVVSVIKKLTRDKTVVILKRYIGICLQTIGMKEKIKRVLRKGRG